MGKSITIVFDNEKGELSLRIDDHTLIIDHFVKSVGGLKVQYLNLDGQKKIIKMLVDNL